MNGYGQDERYLPPSWEQHGYGQAAAPQPYPAPPPYPAYAAAGAWNDPPGYFMGRPLADWGARVLALLVDSAISSIPLLVATPFLVVAMGSIDSTTGEPDSGLAALAGIVFFVGYVVSIGLSLYNLVIRQGRTGQSWGKRMLKLRLVGMRDGRPVGGGMSFLRQLAHALDAYSLYIGYLWPIWDNLRQTFADKVCRTVVLREG